MPGIDVRRDIIAVTPIRFVVPEGTIPVVPLPVVSGNGFELRIAR